MTDKPRIPIDDVEQVVTELTDNTVKQAITLMTYTSGLSFAKIKQLKLSDLTTACKYHMGDGEDIKSLIKRDPIEENMIPMWDVSDENTKRLVFCSPQSLYFIFQHLSERTDESEYLFVNENGKQLDKRYPTNWLTPEFRSKITATDDGGNNNFTAKELSNSFTQLCKSCPPHHLNLDQITKLFKGSSAKKVELFYEKMLEDNTIIFNYYNELLPYLTVNLDNNDSLINVKKDESTSEPITTQETTPSKRYDDEIIIAVSKYYDNQVKDSSHTYEKYIYLTDYVYNVVVTGINLGIYKDISKISFDRLFEQAKIGWVFKQYSKPIHIEFCGKFDEDTINEIMDVLYDVGINVVNDEEFIKCLGMIVNPYFEYADSITITSLELERAVQCYM